MDLRLTTIAESASDVLNPVAHDLHLSSYAIVQTTGADAIAQHIKQRLLFIRGEWHLDESLGTPYYQRVLGKGRTEEAVTSIFRRVIAGTPGVVELVSFALNFDRQNRRIAPEFTVRVDGGAMLTFTELDLGELR